MELTLYAANPAGNITLLVETPVERESRYLVAKQLLEKDILHGEQVGFLTEPQLGGLIRLEMMGGEFCGNAARSVGYWYASRYECDRMVPVEISGCGHVLRVAVDGDSAWADMPIPMSVEPVDVEGIPMTAVRFEGILHLVADLSPLPQKQVAELMPRLAKQFRIPALGIMFLNGDRMTPVVYVEDTDSLIWENSCASGSAAVACKAAAAERDGIIRQDLAQPGGTISTEVICKNGCIVSLRIGGSISVGKQIKMVLS